MTPELQQAPAGGAATGGSRRLATQLAGWTLLLAGAVLLVLPGPGLAFILAGLAVLGKDQLWARRLLEKLRGRTDRVRSGAARVWRWVRSSPA